MAEDGGERTPYNRIRLFRHARVRVDGGDAFLRAFLSGRPESFEEEK